MTSSPQSSNQPSPTGESSGSAQEAAERSSERVQPDDPYTEPPNSTVDDWLGQQVDADMERADADERRIDASPGAHVDDTESDEVPEPNEPA